MTAGKYGYIFFDLDGTLTDPGTGITNSVIYALGRFGIEEKRENLYKFIGPPLVNSFRDFCGFSEEDAWKAVGYYREYFADKGIFENTVYSGMENVLQRLVNAGHKLYVATSKPTEYSVRILEKFALDGYFEYVSGSSLNEKDSSKAEIIAKALRHCGADVRDVLMIGDRKYDIEGAKQNSVASAGVLYGYGGRAELEEAGADFILTSVDDILRFE